jgi:beta-galactosidase
VWLEETSPLAVAPDGTFVFSVFPGNVPQGPAGLRFHTELRNLGPAEAEAAVHWEVRDPAGREVASADASAPVPSADSGEIRGAAAVEHPELWSPEQPRLYTLITEVRSGGAPVDRTETRFGIRTVAFDPERGFLLNGRPYVLKGTANHQDHAGVGAALPDRLQYFRIARLKEMGANAYRTAHNPPAPELLDACDQLGMLVMDENRLVGSDADRMRLWDEQIRRDRNHPSVAIWCLGNEEFVIQGTPEGARVAATMQARVRRLDPTRPVTYNAPLGNEYAGINSVIQVRGWSYHVGAGTMDAYHAAHPLQPNVGSEQGSTVGTRGIYANEPARGYVSAYDVGGQTWSNTAEQWWSFFAVRPWLSGGFAWTGFDYRGEPTPYGWPCVSSQFGILDTCGFPKDNFWYYQAWWTDQPVLHLLPHWNWTGREGQPIKVEALSNCDEVELFLNGRSLGRKAMPRYSHLEWTVDYAPGALAARGYRGGREVAAARVETTGAPAALRLTPARPALDADGNDCAVVDVAVVDRRGRVVPTAGNRVAFELTGAGRLAGVGNGDPSCHEPDVIVAQAPVRSLPIGGWRWHAVPDAYGSPPEAGASFDDSAWPSFDAEAGSGPVGPTSQAVLRAHFRAAAGDLAAPVIELCFGRIAGDARVFVNGREVGSINEPHFAAVFDVKSQLRPGENTVAVALANWGVAGGINQGVRLRFQGPPPPAAWSRSVFNGLAQVILRSGRNPGSIRLAARAEGLDPAVLVLPVRPADSSSELP